MSYFIEGSLEQDILDEVMVERDSHGADTLEVITALAELIRYFAEES